MKSNRILFDHQDAILQPISKPGDDLHQPPFSSLRLKKAESGRQAREQLYCRQKNHQLHLSK